MHCIATYTHAFVYALIMFIGCYMEQDGIWNITWPTTMAGKIGTQKCPGGSEAEGNYTQFLMYLVC